MPNQVVFRRPFRKRGQNPLFVSRSLNKGDVTGSGGVLVGGSADVQFFHAPQVPSDIVVEWDFDNDGDFSETVEDITSLVFSLETFTGRDWPSLLTGKAGPGKLAMTLRNDDDRFNYFNTSSPLVTAPFSLKTGRRVRVRVSGTGNPDPDPLARDRFRRADGALGTSELDSLAWSGPLTDDFVIESAKAVASTEGESHIAILDVNSADYYTQALMSVVGLTANRVGLVYRYVDTSNYSLFVMNPANETVALIDVVSGVESIIASTATEIYSNATLGVLLDGTSVTAYLEGVSILSGTAINTSAESVGIFADWGTDDDRPEIDNFFTWDGLPVEVEGILWTGDISELVSTVEAGPYKLARASGQGWLSKLATQRVTPPVSIVGRKTGRLMGNILAGSLLLHPPGQIDEGDITTGAFVIDESDAIEVARQVEETEYGFLYETQEGYLSFLDRSSRDGALSLVTFTDAPGGMFGYHAIEPYDWRREVFNRIVAGVSSWSEGVSAVLFTDPGPYTLGPGESAQLRASYSGAVSRWTGHTRDVTPATDAPSGITRSTQSNSGTAAFGVTMPATVDSGDLLMILAATNKGTWDETDVPAGWTVLGDPEAINPIWLVKVADGTEDGTTVTLNSFGGDSDVVWAAHVFRITSWYGTLAGVESSEIDQAVSTAPDPVSITPSWGEVPSLFIAGHHDFVATGVTQSAVPSGYGNGAYTVSAFGSNDIGLGTAWKTATTATENPGTFTISASKSWTAYTIAVRGPGATTPVTSSVPSGDNPVFTISYDDGVGGTSQSHTNIEVTGIPLTQGDAVSVQADDFDSQDDHNAIRTYTNPAELFATSADALTYANLVLDTHADDRPILSLSFYASKSPAYRAQAIRRRVNDRITLVATNNAGLGISQDFFIESIGHRWSSGKKLWETTWELSPAL